MSYCKSSTTKGVIYLVQWYLDICVTTVGSCCPNSLDGPSIFRKIIRTGCVLCPFRKKILWNCSHLNMAADQSRADQTSDQTGTGVRIFVLSVKWGRGGGGKNLNPTPGSFGRTSCPLEILASNPASFQVR